MKSSPELFRGPENGVLLAVRWEFAIPRADIANRNLGGILGKTVVFQIV